MIWSDCKQLPKYPKPKLCEASSPKFNSFINLELQNVRSLKVFKPCRTGKLSQSMNVICGLGAGICEAVFAVTPVESLVGWRSKLYTCI